MRPTTIVLIAMKPIMKYWLILAGLTLAASAQTERDPRGPIRIPGLAPRVTADGVEAAGYRYTPAPPSTPWKGAWIWTAGAKPDTAAAYFRKKVTLASAPRKVTAKISADVIYRLYVNGVLVSRGPDDPGRDYDPPSRWSHQWLYDVRDLTPFFTKGTNVIAAEVFTKQQPNCSLGRPGFTFEASIEQPGRPATVVSSGPDWRATPAAAWSVARFKPADPKASPVSYLRYDAERDPANWRSAGFNDSTWDAAVAVESVWGPLAASEIPPRMEAVYPSLTRGPLVLHANQPASVRFGRVLSAYLSVKVRGPAGAVLTIQPNELNKPGFHRMTEVVLRDGVTYYEFPTMDSFSTVNLLVTNAPSPVEIEDVRAGFVSYPVSYRGSFESSDAELNTLWKACRWATQICMQTHHLDSPHHQEPISDPGDYLIEAVENYYAFGEPWLARQDLRKFAGILQHSGYLNFHTSYSLLWLQMLVDYVDYTGDVALARELAPVVHGLLGRFTGWRGRNGLISEAPNYMFLDWVNIGGIACHHPPAVIGQGYMTAFYYRGLADAAQVALWSGDRQLAERYGRLRREVAAAFQRELWNPEKGLYRDGKPFQTSVAPSRWLPADTQIETFSPHVNLLAVLYDLAPKSGQAAIMSKVMAGGEPNTQPYFMHFVFAALDHAGLFEEYAVPQMRRWHLHPDTGTMSEMWTTGDYSHGWIGTPLIQMSARILGVTPAGPGFRKALIRPIPSGLKSARGTTPTPHGNIDVAWEVADGKFTLEVKLPPGVSANAVMPGAGPVTCDGHGAERDSTGAVALPAGVHRLSTAAPPE